MNTSHRASRPWDPTPKEAEVTRAAVSVMAGIDAMIAQLQAQRAAVVEITLSVALAQRERYERVPVGETREGEAIYDPDDAPVRAMISEVSLATRASRRAVSAEIDDVWELANRFGGVRAAFEAGDIDAERASMLVHEGTRLADDEVRAEYERLALPHARAKTLYGARAAARRIAAELEPESLTSRHEKARLNRGVFVRPLDDGMAELCLVSDAVTIYGAHDRLTRMARRVVAARAADSDAEGPATADGEPVVDERTFSQVQADLAIDLLLTGEPDAHHVADPTGLSVLGALRGKVQVTIPVTTLTGLEDAPADLAGYGPVAEAIANPIAATAATWARVFHHPGTGALLTVDRYSPTAEQRRFLVARDQTCVFPHCKRRATNADIDHTHDYARGGKTVVSNLAHVCRFHHVLKHTTAWTYTVGMGGEIRWRSPAGQQHISRAKSAVMFIDAEDARAYRRRRHDCAGQDSVRRTAWATSRQPRRTPAPHPSTRAEWLAAAETPGLTATGISAPF